MAADTYDPILGLILQGTGNNNNAWGVNLNNSMIKLAARATAGMATQAVTGGTLDLSGSPPPASARQDMDHIQWISGTLSSAQTIIVPNLSKTWIFINGTTGAFHLYVKTTSGTATQIPQGTWKMVACVGSNIVKRMDDEEIGSFRISGKAAVGAGELACDGASYLRADYPDLFGKISTTWGAADGTHFNVPNFITSNRFMRAAGGALAVGTYQTGQMEAHTHPITGSPSIGNLAVSADGTHYHYAPLADPTHAHSVTGGVYGGASPNWVAQAVYWYGPISATAIAISGAYTGQYVSSDVGAHYTYNSGSHGQPDRLALVGTPPRPAWHRHRNPSANGVVLVASSSDGQLQEVAIAPPPGVVGATACGDRGALVDTINMLVKTKPQKIGGGRWPTRADQRHAAHAACVARHLLQRLSGRRHLHQAHIYDQNRAQNDVTPYRDTGTLGSNPITVTDGSSIVTITDTAHGLSVGDIVYFSGATAVGGITLSGAYTVASIIDANTYTIIAGTVAVVGNDSFTKVLLHFDGTDAATTFTDSNTGGSAKTWTAIGNAQIDTAAFKFSTASGLFDGTGDGISTPDHADFTLGSGNFTIDCWFNCTSLGGVRKPVYQNAGGGTTTISVRGYLESGTAR
jgi:hypothetical protein